MAEIVQVVHADQVESETRQGWVVTDILPDAQEVEVYREVELAAHNCLAVTRPLFVLRKDADVIAREVALQEKINALEISLEAAKVNVRLTNEHREREVKLAREQTLQAAEQRGFAEAARDNHKKDADIYKERWEHGAKLLRLIRKEIGEAKWREFTGEHSSCVHCIAREGA